MATSEHAGMFGEALASEMQAMQNSNAAFEADMQEAREKEKTMMADIMAGFRDRKKPQVSDQAMRVAKLIDQNPLLLASVTKFVETKLAEIAAAVSGVLGITPEDMQKK